MQAFRVHRGVAMPLLRRDIDTDQIVPKQFLKTVERTGFGRFLFNNWRVREDGTPEPTFVLNDARYAAASILITSANFGCGSSREHAVWALQDYGFRVVIASSFAEIFRNNAVTNGLLPVVLAADAVATLASRATAAVEYCVEVDLVRRRVRDEQGCDEGFEFDDASHHRLLHGLDDITRILEFEDDITRFEQLRGDGCQRRS